MKQSTSYYAFEVGISCVDPKHKKYILYFRSNIHSFTWWFLPFITITPHYKEALNNCCPKITHKYVQNIQKEKRALMKSTNMSKIINQTIYKRSNKFWSAGGAGFMMKMSQLCDTNQSFMIARYLPLSS